MLKFHRVVGESMVPTLRHGEIVAALNVLPIHEGTIVVARAKGRIVIKRVGAVSCGTVELVSDNLEGAAYTIRDDVLYGRCIKLPRFLQQVL